MTGENTLDDYKLNCELLGHSMDVRSVAEGKSFLISGSRDKTVKIWSKDGLRYTEEVTLKDHTNYISCVFYHAVEDWICSGSNDATVQIYRSGELKPFVTLQGHGSTVSCLQAGLEPRSLITGSWDTTARVWTVGLDNQGVVKSELKGHEAAVWSVTTLGDQKYVTGSADKNIFVWNRAGEKVRVLKGHTDCVRVVIGLADGGLVSAGNDAVIKLWNDMGECIRDMYGHENYIYSMSLLTERVVISSGEDSSVRMWDLEKGEQIGDALHLPAQSVWSVCALAATGDIVTGSSDGVVRVFTKNDACQADEGQLRAFSGAVEAFRSEKSKELGGIKVNDLPGPESLLVEGTEGQTRIVRERNGKVMLYKWTANQWNLVGDVTGATGGDQQTSGKTLYEGQEYDYVFSVDVEDGKPPLKLPYNNGEDPYLSAQKFIHKNNLPQVYLEQVANFILDNAKNSTTAASAVPNQGYSDPFTGGSRYIPGGGPSQDLPTGRNFDPFTGASSYSSSKTMSSKFFPTTEYYSFDVGDLTKIEQKLNEFNKQKAGEDQVPEETVTAFVQLAKASATLTLDDVQCLHMFLFWPNDILFPVLDIIRFAMLNEHACRLMLTENGALMEKLLQQLADSSRMATQLMACRALVNMCRHAAGREAFGKMVQIAVSKFPLEATTYAPVQIALATLLLNITVAQFKELNLEQVATHIVTLFGWITDPEAAFRLMVAAGNLIALQRTDVTHLFKTASIFTEKLHKFRLEALPEGFAKVSEIASDLAGHLN